MKVVIAEPIAEKLSDLISDNNKDWVVFADGPKSKQEFIDRIKDAEVATAYTMKFDEEILAQCSKLKYLAIPAVGAGSYVDMDAAKRHGVIVMNCPGYNSKAVAEMAIGMALDVYRNISVLNTKMKQGYWEHKPTNGRLLSGKHIAIIGYGNVGKTIHKLLKEWCSGFNTINSASSSDAIDKALQVSDVVFLCCQQNSFTEGMINAKRLAMMKNNAILINVSRGAIVDEDALYEKLKYGEIAGAGLDVFVEEPGVVDVMPENILRFTRLENVICTSHVAGSSVETREVLGQMIYDNIESCILGSPVNVFN